MLSTVLQVMWQSGGGEHYMVAHDLLEGMARVTEIAYPSAVLNLCKGIFTFNFWNEGKVRPFFNFFFVGNIYLSVRLGGHYQPKHKGRRNPKLLHCC